MAKKTKSNKSKKSSSSKKTKSVVTPTPVVETPVVETPVVTETTSETTHQETSPCESLYTSIIETSKEMTQLHKRITSTLKRVHKAYHRECKELRKRTLKNKRRTKDPSKPKRPPSGFAKPTQITNTLCDFLGVPHGEKVARTDVTKKVTTYIKTNNLQVPTNKRQFIPDDKLQSILGPLDSVKKDKNGKTDAEKGYTYFNLQKYLSSQFPKTTTA